MSRYVFTVNLKDDPAVIETYTQHHRRVWPEVEESLLRVGVERMDIYLLGRRLVMIVEMPDGLDYRTAFRSHAASSPRVAEWEQLMLSLQEPPPEARAGEWWALMEPVYGLDRHTAATSVSQGAAAPGPQRNQEPAIAHVADRSRTS